MEALVLLPKSVLQARKKSLKADIKRARTKASRKHYRFLLWVVQQELSK